MSAPFSPAARTRTSTSPAPGDAILLGGAAADPGLLGRAAEAGLTVSTTYGMSETSGGCVYDGVPLDGMSIDLSPDDRVTITGPVVFSGYRLRPDLTAEALSIHTRTMAEETAQRSCPAS